MLRIPVRQGYVTTDDSVRLAWRTVGEGRDTVIVLHGGPGQGHSNALAPDLMPLAVGRTLLFYDQRGAGRSATIRDTASVNVRHSVRDLDALRRHFGLERLTLLGYSYGGLLAGMYAVAYPERVQRMVLLAALGPTVTTFRSFRPGARIDSILNAARLEQNRAWRAERTDSTKACWDYWMIWIRGFYSQPPQHRRMWGDICNVPQANMILPARGYAQRSVGQWDITAGLKRVNAPVLVVHGDRDPMPIEAAHDWVTALPNARLLPVAGAGHFPHVDRPSVFFPAVDAFLRAQWPEPSDFPGRAGAMGSIPQGASLYERIFREIWAVDELLINAIARGDWAQVASLYTDDATIFAPGSPPVHNRQAIAAFWEAARKKGLHSLELQIMQLEGHGDIVHAIGKYTMRGANGEEVDIGKFLAVWKKVGGQWRLYRDIFNSNLETRSPLEVPDYLPLPRSYAFVTRSEVAAPRQPTPTPPGSYLLQSLEDSSRWVRFSFFRSEVEARQAGGEVYRLVLRTPGPAPLPTHAVYAEWQLDSSSAATQFEHSRANLFSLRAEHLESFHADLLFQSVSERTRYLILGLYASEAGLHAARAHPQIRAFAQQNPPSRFGARDLYGVRNFRIVQP